LAGTCAELYGQCDHRLLAAQSDTGWAEGEIPHQRQEYAVVEYLQHQAFGAKDSLQNNFTFLNADPSRLPVLFVA
jgi:hypothetical protein